MTATIYFSGSISGGRGDVAQYRRIVTALEAAGHRVLAGAVASEEVSAGGETISNEAIFTRDMRWIEEADLVVAEVSTPSTGVGYEIAAARYHYAIPVIALWRPGISRRCSAMISGDAGIELIEYGDDLEAMLPRLLDAIEETGLESIAHGGRSPARLP